MQQLSEAFGSAVSVPAQGATDPELPSGDRICVLSVAAGTVTVETATNDSIAAAIAAAPEMGTASIKSVQDLFTAVATGDDVAGVGQAAKYSESASTAVLTVVQGDTFFTITFTDGAVAPKSHVVTLGQQVVADLAASTTSTD